MRRPSSLSISARMIAIRLVGTSDGITRTAEGAQELTSADTAAAHEVNRDIQDIHLVASGTQQMGPSIGEISENAVAAARITADAVRAAETTNETVAALGQSSTEIGRWSRWRSAAALLPVMALVAAVVPTQSSVAAAPPVPPKPFVRSVTSYAPPGVGAAWRNSLKTHSQVIVADGVKNSWKVKLTLWTYTGKNKWRNDGVLPAVAGKNGWYKQRQGDRRSPVGVFGLTDAGGYYPNPGTRLPYRYAPRSEFSYLSFGVRIYSYVIAINYNHVVGTPPTSNRLTMPYYKGNKIWLHQTSGTPGGSYGCVTVTRGRVVQILRWLNPKSKPVILMGPHSQIVRPR